MSFPWFCLAAAKVWRDGWTGGRAQPPWEKQRMAQPRGEGAGWPKRPGREVRCPRLTPSPHLSPPAWARSERTGLARRAVCFTWGPHSSPRTFLYSILWAFPFSFSHHHFGLLFPVLTAWHERSKARVSGRLFSEVSQWPRSSHLSRFSLLLSPASGKGKMALRARYFLESHLEISVHHLPLTSH